MMNPEDFRVVVKREFQFLATEYACRVIIPNPKQNDPSWALGYDINYENNTTSVDITFQVPEQLPTVRLRRLITVPDQINSVPLGLLLIVRAPDLNPLKDFTMFPLKKSSPQLLIDYAHALKNVGHDVLIGDFKIFPDLQKERDRQMQIRSTHGSSSFIYF